jgi:hypothetical protein
MDGAVKAIVGDGDDVAVAVTGVEEVEVEVEGGFGDGACVGAGRDGRAGSRPRRHSTQRYTATSPS